MTIIDIFVLLLTGLAAGLAGGLFGIGGGVVIVPALYAAFTADGVPEDVRIKLAVGTSLATIIVTSIRSVQGHHRHGNVEWPVLKSWAPWIMLGAITGSFIARYADATVLTLIFGTGLIAIGAQRMLTVGRQMAKPGASLPGKPIQAGIATGLGIFSSLMGIGGGVIGVLVLTLAGRSVHRAVGTSAGFGFAIAVPGAIGYVLAGWGQQIADGTIGFVSIPAFLAVAVGTGLAAPYGAKLAHRLNPKLLTQLFATYVLITGGLMVIEAVRG